jgi:hypothetical protein
METILLATAVFAVAFAGMAVGVILQGREKELKGSCGGVGNDADCCKTCPEKAQCDSGADLADEFEQLAAREASDHPALAQAPSSATASGQPVATPQS